MGLDPDEYTDKAQNDTETLDQPERPIQKQKTEGGGVYTQGRTKKQVWAERITIDKSEDIQKECEKECGKRCRVVVKKREDGNKK